MHLYRYLAKQVYKDPNCFDGDTAHRIYAPQRKAREQTIVSLKRLLTLIEHFGEMKRITEEAKKETGTGLPF